MNKIFRNSEMECVSSWRKGALHVKRKRFASLVLAKAATLSVSRPGTWSGMHKSEQLIWLAMARTHKGRCEDAGGMPAVMEEASVFRYQKRLGG